MAEAADYWRLADRAEPCARTKAQEAFDDAPPGSAPGSALVFGWQTGAGLAGIATLSPGFPAAGEAYLGLMLLAPRARGAGLGAALLRGVEGAARAGGAARLFLAVLEENPRGRAFWQREGFAPTGLSRQDAETGHRLHRLGKVLGPDRGACPATSA